MARIVNSFDVFDTLIARRSVEPRLILERLEALADLSGLVDARLAADRSLGARGRPYNLHDIWEEVRRTTGYDAHTMERLLKMEIELEHAEVIPITENLAQVREGDVLVSDTYLPAEVVLSLLRSVGLEQTVALAVTNDGKFRGWVWPRLQATFTIREHLGDNLHSDGASPSKAGIRAVIYTGAKRSMIEQLLTDRGWESLANLMREARLANPFSDKRPAERDLWLLSCEYNFPLLFFASMALERYAKASSVREVLFVSRDSLMWHNLYQRLFPDRKATYLYTSRKCLVRPSESYLKYFCSVWHQESVIVDLFSTGASWSQLFARLKARARLFTIGIGDSHPYMPDALPPGDTLDMIAVFRNSEVGFPVTKGVEMLNYAPHPIVEDVVLLPGYGPLPVLADDLEYDPGLPEAAQRAFRVCVAALAKYRDLLGYQNEVPGDLIRTFVRLICEDQHLPAIYPNHRAADAVYEQRLRT